MIKVRVAGRTGRADIATLDLSSQDAARLGVRAGAAYPLDIGKWSTAVEVQVSEGGHPTLTLPRRAPHLPVRRLALYKVDGGRLRLGPLIGILIMYRVTARGPRGSQMETYVELMQHARDAGALAFICRAAALRRGGATVSGWTRAGGRWVRCRLPYPDVVYNRICSRPVERLVLRQGLFRMLERRGIPVFNPHYLNKWGVHRTLMQDDRVRPFLPETRRYRSSADVRQLLNRYGRVFFKPAGGSLGLGAVLVTRAGSGLAYKMNTMSGRRRTGRLRSLEALHRVLPRRRDYLVQRGIHLAQVNGRPFDVRALVQKDVTGQWRLTGAAARVAGRGRITTHVPRGGSRRPLVPVLRTVFGPERAVGILQRLEEACLSAARAYERLTGEMFGEFSLDVAIDTDGDVWILEMNAKPFRFDEYRLRTRAQRRFIRFATHLAGCPVPEEEQEPAAGVSEG